jgi:hypothetical protein
MHEGVAAAERGARAAAEDHRDQRSRVLSAADAASGATRTESLGHATTIRIAM